MNLATHYLNSQRDAVSSSNAFIYICQGQERALRHSIPMPLKGSITGGGRASQRLIVSLFIILQLSCRIEWDFDHRLILQVFLLEELCGIEPLTNSLLVSLNSRTLLVSCDHVYTFQDQSVSKRPENQ
jgi:hypothetical protein